jgi:hypothetical protein
MPSVFSSSVNEMPWLIRADFTDQVVWDDVVRAVGADESSEGHREIDFVVVDEAEFDGLTPARLLQLEPDKYGTFFVVDLVTVTHPEHPLLAVDVGEEPGRSFRLIPSQVQEFAVNMLISNLDFADFVDNLDPDAIFRGFGLGASSVPMSSAITIHHEEVEKAGDGLAGLIGDVGREADPDDAKSFIGQLISERFWNPASWQRLEAGMREACRRYDGTAEIPRELTDAFHSVMVRTPNLVAQQGMTPMDSGALEVRLERIRVLSAWIFRGWTLDRCDEPLPGEYDPNAPHG